jgi:hypothetical protein
MGYAVSAKPGSNNPQRGFDVLARQLPNVLTNDFQRSVRAVGEPPVLCLVEAQTASTFSVSVILFDLKRG